MLVIKNARVFTADSSYDTPEFTDSYPKLDIEITGSKFTAIEKNLRIPDSATIIDANGLFVMPGLVDAHSHIGGFSGDDQDLNEMTAAATPEVEAYYGIDFMSKKFARATAAGITTSLITPGSGNVIGGLACAVKHTIDQPSQMCIKNKVAMKMALGGNPKGVYGPRNQRPMTRMGIAQVIRDELAKAREYLQKKESGQEIDFNPGYENLGLALRREIPVKVHCEQYDMLTILKIAEEFNLEITIDHAWGSSDFYSEIINSTHLRGVIFGPIGVLLLPGECGKTDIECLATLDSSGVLCSIMTDGPIMAPDMLVGQTGEAVRTGTPHHRALRMITCNAAKIIGLDHRLGSIKVGNDADLAFFKGIPALDTDAYCVRTIVDGRIQYQA